MESASELHPVVVQTIREQIAGRLRSEILSGELAEGEPLRETRLAQRFRVSRGPVRDALLQLTQEGLLIARPNVGVRVCGAPSEAVRPLMVEIRRQIERHALNLALPRITRDDLTHWRRILADLHSACQRSDPSAAAAHELALHRALVERAGDPDLLALWLPAAVRVRWSTARRGDLVKIHADHDALLSALSTGDWTRSAAALSASLG